MEKLKDCTKLIQTYKAYTESTKLTGCCPNPPGIKTLDTKKFKSAIIGENIRFNVTHLEYGQLVLKLS